MKKITRILATCILGCFCISANAQQGVVASGGDGTGAGGSVSFSIGQIDYVTASGSTGTALEGIQMPFEITVVSVPEQITNDFSATVYPNPTANVVSISVNDDKQENLNYQLCDNNGRIITTNQITNSQLTNISMAELPAGYYHLRIFNSTKELKTFQIIKTVKQ